MSTRPFWEKILAIFDPELPVTDVRLFAERDPAYNPLVTLERALRRPVDVSYKCLIAGTIGNGKTSELHHFADRLAPHRMIVLVDLWRHFQGSVRDVAAMGRLDTWELLGLLGMAIHRAAEEVFEHRWGREPDQLGRALDELRRTKQGEGAGLDVAKLGKGIAVAASKLVGGGIGAGLVVLGAALDGARWSWRIGTSDDQARDDQDIRNVLDAVNDMIRALEHAYGRRLVLLVDGLDRAPDRVAAFFIDSGILGQLACDAVWIAPDVVRRLDSSVRGFEVQELCNVPVFDRHDPGTPGPGLAFFRSLVDKRLALVREQLRDQLGDPGPSEPFPTALVDRLAHYCGGVSRDFVKMIRLAAGEAWDAEAPCIDESMVEFTLRESRRAKERGLNAAEIALLEQLMADREHKLPPGELAANLVAEQRLLAYPNDTTWYYPHPLLTLELLQRPSGSGG